MDVYEMDVFSYSSFCAPVVLAALAGISKVDAARVLKARNLATATGGTKHWKQFLSVAGGTVFFPKDPDGSERWRKAVRRWERGERWTYPRRRTLERYTVAGFLRVYRVGTYVLTTRSHTLLVRDGRVLVDTLVTESKRARVQCAHRFVTVPDPRLAEMFGVPFIGGGE